jgi:hypothetical protein
MTVGLTIRISHGEVFAPDQISGLDLDGLVRFGSSGDVDGDIRRGLCGLNACVGFDTPLSCRTMDNDREAYEAAIAWL